MSVSDVLDDWLRSPAPAVIFDFNGTLSDDEPILFDIFGALFSQRLGWTMTADEYRDRLLGRSDREIITYAVTTHGHGGDEQIRDLLELRQREYQRRVAEHNPITEHTAGLVDVLAEAGFPLAIVTGAQRDDVAAVLRHSAVGPLFGLLIAEEDVANGKPHPEGYLAAARILDRRPQDVLVFEDSVPGVQAALAAGMHCIAVAANPSPELAACAPAIVGALTAAVVEDALSHRRRAR